MYISGESCIEFVVGGDDTTTPTTTTNSTKLCFASSNGTSSCHLQMDGQVCTSCTITEDLTNADCSNVVKGLMIPNVKTFADFPVIQACHKPVINGTVCDLCGSGGYVSYYDTTVISLEGFGGTTTTTTTSSFTCTDLLYANNAHQISSDKCPDAIEVAQAKCCAYACEICVYPLILDDSKADDPLFDVLDFGETTEFWIALCNDKCLECSTHSLSIASGKSRRYVLRPSTTCGRGVGGGALVVVAQQKL